MYFIHELADVQTKNIGQDTKIWQYCVVFAGAEIGCNCNICALVLIENDVVVGNNVTVKSGVQLWNGVKIEDDVFIGPNVTFTNDLNPRSKNHNKPIVRTLIKKGASIGANSTIIAGNVVGQYSFIGAGSVVTKNVPDNTVWFGNPAIQHGFITRSGILLDTNMYDSEGLLHELEE